MKFGINEALNHNPVVVELSNPDKSVLDNWLLVQLGLDLLHGVKDVLPQQLAKDNQYNSFLKS